MKRLTPTDLSNRTQMAQAFDHLVKATQCLDRVKGGLDVALAELEKDAPSKALVLRAFVHMVDPATADEDASHG